MFNFALCHPQYYVRALSEDWLAAEELLPLNFSGLILPERMPPNTGACSCLLHACGVGVGVGVGLFV